MPQFLSRFEQARSNFDEAIRPLPVLLVMLGLTGFAISQPLLSVFGGEPTFFAFRNVEGWDLVWFALAVAIVPPCIAWIITTVATGASKVAGMVVHITFVFSLSTLTAIQLIKSTGIDSPPAVAVASVTAASAVSGAYYVIPGVRSWARLTSVLPLVAVLSFLFASETSDLLRPVRQVDEIAAPATSPTEAFPNVVMVVFDELPTLSLIDDNGDIDSLRYPNIARLAKDATWHRDFSTVATLTAAAVPALLTGSDPVGGAPIWANYPDNLFSLLAPTHHLTVFEAPTALCGVDTCGEGAPGEGIRGAAPQYGELLGGTLDVFRERIALRTDETESWDDFEERVEDLSDLSDTGLDEMVAPGLLADVATSPSRLVEFLDTFTTDSDPTLYFLHLLLPHAPWLFYEDGTSYSPPVGDPPPGDYYPIISPYLSRDPWALAVSEQRHLLQTSYADRLLGLILDGLEAKGIFDESLIVITSDHGLTLAEGTTNNRGLETSGAIEPEGVTGAAFSPLLIKEPDQTAGRVDDSHLMSIDVVPTIADIVGLTMPWEVDGAAAGSDDIANRGDERYIFEMKGSLTTPEVGGRFEFTASQFTPQLSDRYIGLISPGEPAVAGLYDTLEASDAIGRPLDEFVVATGGRAGVFALGDLLQPPSDRAAPGLITGRLYDATSTGEVLVAVNDIVVAASPQHNIKDLPGGFTVLLDRDVLGEQNTVRMALATDDGYVELNLEEV